MTRLARRRRSVHRRARGALVLIGGVGLLVPLARVSGSAAASSSVPCASTSAGVAFPGAGTLQVQCKWQVFLPGQVYQSSPNLAHLDAAGESIVVGSRDSGQVYALHLADGSPVSGWPADTPAAVDSSPTVLADPSGSGLDDVVVDSGDVTAGPPPSLALGNGAVTEFSPQGTPRWSEALSDRFGAYGPNPALYASPAAADTTGSGHPSLVVGGVSLTQDDIDAGDGADLVGWPRKTADTTFATAALADLQGGNLPFIVAGSDSSAGPGALYDWNGGAVRAEDGYGRVRWVYRSDEVVTSSPAVGDLAGTGDDVVFGHGRYWSDIEGSADATTVTALDSNGKRLWQTDLRGYTPASPALADLSGSGTLDVVEPTWTAAGSSTGGAVYALGPTGTVLWGPVYQSPLPGTSAPPANVVFGGAATADFGEGYQDVVYASGYGWNIVDGRSGQSLLPTPQTTTDNLNGEWVDWDGDVANLAMQDTPLVTPDPSGSGLDVVLAGTYAPGDAAADRGFLAVYWVHGPTNNVGPRAWPMFHHDPQHTGSMVPAPESCPGCLARDPSHGYWLVGADGGIFAFGGAPYLGSMGATPLAKPVVAMSATPDGQGYWLVASDGGVFAFGDAPFYGSTGAVHLASPVVGMARTTDGLGYWLVASDGGVFSFGDATFHGSMGGHQLGAPVVGMTAIPGGGGYWLVAADGGMFAFDAPFDGSMGGQRLAQPMVAMGAPPAPVSGGYWELAADGGIFAFGGAPFAGSTGAQPLSAPIVGMASDG